MRRMVLEIVEVIVTKSISCWCGAVCDVAGVSVACICEIRGNFLVDFEGDVETGAVEVGVTYAHQ
jgi:hypothetical protein